MLLAVVCLWIGFAAGFVCAALLAGSRGRRAGKAAPALDLSAAVRPFKVMRVHLRKRRGHEEVEQDR